MSADTVARLKITLDVVKPTVLRRIEVPFFVPAMWDGARSIQKPIGPKTFSMRARRVSTR